VIECQKCSRKATLFLCDRCQHELAFMLKSLALGPEANGHHGAGWLQSLAEAAVGQTRLGGIIRHQRGDEVPLRFNLRASQLLDQIHAILVEWTRDLCDSRGADVPILNTTAEIAIWLSDNVSAIASDEGAGICYREVSEAIQDIQRMIDRPLPRRFCGPCPTVVEHGHYCGTALLAAREATEVLCPICKITHDVEDVMARLVDDLGEWSFTYHELQSVVLPALNEPVPARTFRSWIHKRKLLPARYRRPDGTSAMAWETPQDRPEYKLAAVRALRSEKPQKAKTGRAARKEKV
jgi:hypothetical protein